jgi:DNA-binding NarL/FixJ family response regulator
MKRVLIVDDSKEVRQRLIALLAEYPTIRIVGQAANGEEAIDMLDDQKPDAVILDIRLPGRNGIQLLREIKAAHPEITVIMLTNYDFEQYRKQCMQFGADYFFNKTLEFEKVVDVLVR